MQLLDRAKYYTAVQNPHIVFTDEDLRQSHVVERMQGTPLAFSGTFATIFKLKNSSEEWAVRCFNKNVADLNVRYSTINNFIDIHEPKFLEWAVYQRQGIRVDTEWYPIIKMSWIKGATLDTFIENNIDKPEKLGKLAPRFLKLIRELQQYGIAHGDLQHGNIMVKGERLILVDYDSFFLPGISYLSTTNAGHENYQHPYRQINQYDSKMDRFSALVIYLGLLAVGTSTNPEVLWEKYGNGDNILFSRADFIDPENSRLLTDLVKVSEIATLVSRFKLICQGNTDDLPTLDEFISGSVKQPTSSKRASGSRSPKTLYPVLSALESNEIKKHLGERVVIIGQITDIRENIAYNRKPYAFLNFGKFPDQSFQLVLWSEALEALRLKGASVADFEGKWVSVTGIVGRYRNYPQFDIEIPTQIQVLTGAEEARKRLLNQLDEKPITPVQKKVAEKKTSPISEVKLNAPTIRVPMTDDSFADWLGVTPISPTYSNYKPPVVNIPSTNQKEEDKHTKVFGELYGNKPIAPAPKSVSFPLQTPSVPQQKIPAPYSNNQLQQNEYDSQKVKRNYGLLVEAIIFGMVSLGFVIYWTVIGFSGRYMNGVHALISGAVILVIIYLMVLKGLRKI